MQSPKLTAAEAGAKVCRIIFESSEGQEMAEEALKARGAKLQTRYGAYGPSLWDLDGIWVGVAGRQIHELGEVYDGRTKTSKVEKWRAGE